MALQEFFSESESGLLTWPGLDLRLHDALGERIFSRSTYVFDRAYADLRLWNEIRKAGSHFVTRLKKTTQLRIDHFFLYLREFQDKEGVLLTLSA